MDPARLSKVSRITRSTLEQASVVAHQIHDDLEIPNMLMMNIRAEHGYIPVWPTIRFCLRVYDFRWQH